MNRWPFVGTVSAAVISVSCMLPVVYIKVKGKVSHTRCRALGPELILVYRQSARR